MLELADVGPDDLVLDLGSGDGRVVIAAARDHGARAVGVEIDPALVHRSREAVAAAGLGGRVRIVQGDLHRHPLKDATVITVFLWPSDNLRLRTAILRDMMPGARVISHDHDMDGWVPDARIELDSPEVLRRYGEPSMVYLWIVPARFEGCWSDARGSIELELRQGFQVLGGSLRIGDRVLRLDAGRAKGAGATLIARDDVGSVEVELRAGEDSVQVRSTTLGIETPLASCEGS